MFRFLGSKVLNSYRQVVGQIIRISLNIYSYTLSTVLHFVNAIYSQMCHNVA